jgi:hypothetical protein
MPNDSWPPRWLTPISEDSIVNGEGPSVMKFAENFGIITKDSVAGKAGAPLNLRDWQQNLIGHVFAWDLS